MIISKIKSIWAAVVRDLEKILKSPPDARYPYERMDRIDRYRDEHFMRFF